MSRQGLTGKSRARKLAAVREYFRYLLNHEMIAKSPAEGIETPKREKRSRDFLQRGEYNTFLSLAGGNVRDYAIFQVFLQSGVRVSELVNLSINDIDFTARELHVREGKGKAARTIPLEQKALKALKNYLAIRGDNYPDHLFLNRYGEPIGERAIQKLVAHYSQQSGLTKKASPHTFRHTFATQKAKSGVSPYKLLPSRRQRESRRPRTQVRIHSASGQVVVDPGGCRTTTLCQQMVDVIGAPGSSASRS